MIEQRRKQRFTYSENDRDLSPAGTIKGRSQLKTARDTKEGQIKYNKLKESPILAVKGQYSYTQNLI